MKKATAFWCVIIAWALTGSTAAKAQGQGHGGHPPLPTQRLYFGYRLVVDGRAAQGEIAIQMPSPAAAAELDQLVELPALPGALRLTRYLPRAVREQSVVPDESGTAQPAIRISIDGPTQSYRLWLAANDPGRNRLTSLIGTWRYMSVADELERGQLFAQFKNELARTPQVVVSRADGSRSHEVPARPGAVRVLEDLGCRLSVRAFFPHFAFDKDKNKPVNLSDKRINPAALVEIEHDGKKEQRWLFAKFPDFRAQGSQSLPLRVGLDCPLENRSSTPEFVLVTIDRAAHEAWARHDGTVSSQRIEPGKPITVTGSQYTFHIERFVPSGRLVEEYRRADSKGSVPALQIELVDKSGTRTRRWLTLGRQHVTQTERGPMAVWFGPRRGAAPKEHGAAP